MFYDKHRPLEVEIPTAIMVEPLAMGVPEFFLYAEVAVGVGLFLLSGCNLVFGFFVLIALAGLVHAPLMDLTDEHPSLPARCLRNFFEQEDFPLITALVPRIEFEKSLFGAPWRAVKPHLGTVTLISMLPFLLTGCAGTFV